MPKQNTEGVLWLLFSHIQQDMRGSYQYELELVMETEKKVQRFGKFIVRLQGVKGHFQEDVTIVV